MEPETKDIIEKLIVSGGVTIIGAILTHVLSSLELHSKDDKKQLDDLLKKVLFNLDKLLKNKEAETINEKDIKELMEIYDNNYYIIPESMQCRYKDIIIEFQINNCLSNKSFNAYKKHIKLMISDIRKKLGLEKNFYFVELLMLPFPIKVILFLSFSIAVFLSEGFVLTTPKPELAVFIIACYVIIFFTVVGLVIIFRHFKRKRQKNKLKKKQLKERNKDTDFTEKNEDNK